MAKVVSVNISEKKGTLKKPVPEIELKLRHGIVGDATRATGTVRSLCWRRRAWTPCGP